VLTAQGESPAAQEALEKLCRTYWRPIYSFIRRQDVGPEEAEDLTQGFFALLLERRDLSAVRREKGRLRSYLLVSLKHFLADQRRRTMAIKRGKGQRLIPLEELRANEPADMEPADPLTAERIYERRWASTLLEQVLRRLKDEYRAAGNAALFDRLKQLLPDEPGAPSQADIAAKLGMTENAVLLLQHEIHRRRTTRCSCQARANPGPARRGINRQGRAHGSLRARAPHSASRHQTGKHSCSIKKANRTSPTSDWRDWSRQKAPSHARWKCWARRVTWRQNKRWETTQVSPARQMFTGSARCFTNC
jgi:RNA polymerase sigma factor (sigma-70 family)